LHEVLVGLCVIKLNGADLACERSKRPNEEKKKKGKKKRKRKEGKKKRRIRWDSARGFGKKSLEPR